MSIESVLAGEIQKIHEAAALIADRVYPVAAPQSTPPPFVTYRRVPGEVMYTQGGESNAQKAHFQIAAVTETYDGALTLAAAIRTGLSGKRGLGDGSITMHGIFLGILRMPGTKKPVCSCGRKNARLCIASDQWSVISNQ